jgi:hypothetical protein
MDGYPVEEEERRESTESSSAEYSREFRTDGEEPFGDS